MRTGVRPDRTSVDKEKMPWDVLGRMLIDNEELRAFYAHLQEVNSDFVN